MTQAPTPVKNADRDDILLEAGTNELEVLVFDLAGSHFGVNVAKVREVIKAPPPTATPDMHPSVLGMFNMRGTLIPLVDLAKHLDLQDGEPAAFEDRRVIVMEFNGRQTGFVVDGVEQIYRVSWGSVRSAPDVHKLGQGEDADRLSSCTGVLEIKKRLILMIDFESIADAITLERKLHVEEVDNPGNVDRASKRVILAEDSVFMRQMMVRVFSNSGYDKLEVYPDGLQAWRAIESSKTDGSQPIDVLVSDIEMPQMDGLHLTKRIKADPQLASIPVILFSSLISQDNINKGEQVGATLQIPKPELAEMVRLVDKAASGQADQLRSHIGEAA